MVEALRWLETLLLVAAVAVAFRRRATPAVALYLAFLCAYGAKLLLGEPVRYAGDGAWRSVYLGLLALHALGVAIGPVFLVGWSIARRRAQIEPADRWRRRFLGVWLVAALAGVLAFTTFMATS